MAADRATVLIVDDDDVHAGAIERVLEANGYGVRRAADGAEGVRQASEAPPDLILLDFMMPGKDGFAACREMRTLEHLRRVPILALTAFGQDIGEVHGLARAREAGWIQEFMEKPVEPNVLLERMAALLGR